MSAHNKLRIDFTAPDEYPSRVSGSALDAIFEQRVALLRTVGPAVLQGMRDADDREDIALAERLDCSPRRLADSL